jgi:hypothetical protein
MTIVSYNVYCISSIEKDQQGCANIHIFSMTMNEVAIGSITSNSTYHVVFIKIFKNIISKQHPKRHKGNCFVVFELLEGFKC